MLKEAPVLQVTSKQNSAGFTLIEVMVSVLVLTVGMLGLLQTIILATDQNLRNQMRTEAVQIGETNMHEMRERAFANLTGNHPVEIFTVPSRLPGLEKDYTVTKTIAPVTNASRNLIVDVKWKFKNFTAHHQVSSMRANEKVTQ